MLHTTHYKKLLVKEISVLERELNHLGVHALEKPAEWDASLPTTEHESEEGDVAMKIEEYAERVALVLELQTRHKEVFDALERIKHGTYGMCVVGKKSHPIEKERLDADVAAKACIAHMKK